MFVPYRKFAATEEWLTVGPVIHRALDDHSFDDLDARIIDAEREGAPVVFGSLRYTDRGVEVAIAKEAAGFRLWLDPRLSDWAGNEGVELVGLLPSSAPSPDP